MQTKLETVATRVRLYHYWVQFPGGKRAHRYIVADPEATFWGLFWSRREAEAFCSGWPGIILATVAPLRLPSYAKPVGWIEWKRG